MRIYETLLIRIHSWSNGQSIFALHAHVKRYGSEDDFTTGYGPTVGFQVKIRRFFHVIKDPALTISVNHVQFEFTLWL